MTTPMFEKDDQGVPLIQLFPTFTADYDPEGSVDEEETPTERPRPTLENPAPTEYSEMLPGESELRARDYAKPSDLSLEEQMSQFIAAPWDEEPYEDSEYLELSIASDLEQVRLREARVQANIAQYRLEHPEAVQEV